MTGIEGGSDRPEAGPRSPEWQAEWSCLYAQEVAEAALAVEAARLADAKITQALEDAEAAQVAEIVEDMSVAVQPDEGLAE